MKIDQISQVRPHSPVLPAAVTGKAAPFSRRAKLDTFVDATERLQTELTAVLAALEQRVDPDAYDYVQLATDVLAQRWKLKDDKSETAFTGLLLVLEHCLSHELENEPAFEHFVKALGFHTVFFWKKSVPVIYDSDMSYGTHYRDALLFSLSLFDVNMGQNRLRELYAAVPGVRNSLLGKHAKRFEERFNHVVRRRNSQTFSASHTGSAADHDDLAPHHDLDEDLKAAQANGHCPESQNITDNLLEALVEEGGPMDDSMPPARAQFDVPGSDLRPRTDSMSTPSSDQGRHAVPESVTSGGLAVTHTKERVINVSNAPPVSIKKGTEGWSISQGSGGLVSCVNPVMTKDKDNVWLANLGPDLNSELPLSPTHSNHDVPPAPSPDNRPSMDRQMSNMSQSQAPLSGLTNTLGLPIIRKAHAKGDIRLQVLKAPAEEDETASQIRENMSLVGVLRDYNRDNYKLNPVVVGEDDYNVYYGGISNGLLWPALHNLPEYIVADYDQPNLLREHWHAYVRVNYQFAINAVRNSRPQDFIWIHDYHMLLTGMIMQSFDPNLEAGLFLHIPFQPPEIFFTKYDFVALACLRGMLRFNKVGFQTHLDRQTFVDLVRKHIRGAKVQFLKETDTYQIAHEGYTASLGVFPVSIKNEEFLDFVNSEEIQKQAVDIRQNAMKPSLDGGKLFFSVERFDYTKGIKEKLQAYKRYLEKYPDRHGKDVLLQVAVINRRSVDTYREYQDVCLALAKEINEGFRCADAPEWKPLVFRTDGLPRSSLVAHYMAMDVGLVAPRRDGMNLVAKEMIICNPKLHNIRSQAALMITTGAGTEQQLHDAGFYSDERHYYHRIADMYDADAYADVFYEAATTDGQQVEQRSTAINKFLMANDIEKWSAAFLDPNWTHEVVRKCNIRTLNDFYHIMLHTVGTRRQIVQRVLKGTPIKAHFRVSLTNALQSLVDSCAPADADGNTTLLVLAVADDARQTAKLDVSDEISELRKDLAFLDHVESETVDNVEQFVDTLRGYHPVSPEMFHEEVLRAMQLMAHDHFNCFFTDRDGTLKSYSCSYPSSVQPAYAAVIQSTFARRCATVCAILTSAPLKHIGILDVHTMPEGYYFYGASAGREWYLKSSNKWKDDTLSVKDLELLDKVFERIQELLEEPQYRAFTWLGSGLQKHYGHITVARQDCYGSVDESVSALWYNTICDVVHDIDPSANVLHVHETELDIKIYIKAKLSGRIFNKGHGIHVLTSRLNMTLNDKTVLVCGDTEGDLPMLEECLRGHPKKICTVWVTKSDELKKKVRALMETYGHDQSSCAFVSCPEVLLGAMAQATIREIRLREPDKPDSDDEDEQ